MEEIKLELLTPEAFAPFGDIIQISGEPDKIINQGLCGRYHDLAALEAEDGGRIGISLFKSEKRDLPYQLDMMERHPLGSQVFIPMGPEPFLIIVAEDDGGKPGYPRAFITEVGQGVNYRKNTWHGVLTPLSEPGLFAVVDWIGDKPNLEEHWFDEPYLVLE